MDLKTSLLPDKEKIAGVVLAAGASSRMGQPKALLEYQGESFLSNCILKLKRAGLNTIWVVSGAGRAEIQSIIHSHGVEEVFNENWKTGMSSSIKTAIFRAQQRSIPALLVALVDQPLITDSHFRALFESFDDSGYDAVASKYSHTIGPPVLIKRRIYDHFNELKGDGGGKNILMNLGDRLYEIPCQACEKDIDTIEQFQRLTTSNQ